VIALAVVPARGGSTGIPNKNLVPLVGRPLLAYTATAALASRRLSRVLLSTDSPTIAEAGRALGLDVPFLRPAALAVDDAPMLPVLQHAVETLAASGFVTDAVVLLQPTSPLRRAEHIDAAIDLLESSGADSVVSVVEVPHQYNPLSIMTLDGGRLRPYATPTPAPATVARRQDKPLVYARNGPAVLAVRTAVILGGSLYGNDTRPLVMSPRDSLDIDEVWDLELAELLLSTRAG
jgi:CMP-N-acetylneuraminic acid synthetase